ncbi:MAG: hypothetical protein HRT61_02520 [Ekhidna sp.]|nr:hypothetical protein [Ekhidna sp.]
MISIDRYTIMMSGLEEIREKIDAFKKRYYTRQIILGSILFLILNALVFLLLTSIESQLWLNSVLRAVFLFGFIGLIAISAYHFIIQPTLRLLNISNGLTDNEAAEEIAKYFPEIEDKLLNTLQLSLLERSELLNAAISKKSNDFHRIRFIQAVDFKPVKKYGAGLLATLLIFSLVSFINPSIISESSGRIVNFKKEFTPTAPFSFIVLNENLKGFRGEDFTLNVKIEGDQLPENVNSLVDGRSTPVALNYDTFQYTISNIQSSKTIQFEAAGFKSKTYVIDVNNRPDLVSMLIRIEEPSYTGGAIRTVENSGNITVLEGSTVIWELGTIAVDSAHLIVHKEKEKVARISENTFGLQKRLTEDSNYEFQLFNRYSSNKSELSYFAEVVKDEYPVIKAQYFPDSIGYEFLAIAGSIADDYGFQGLQINYRKENQKKYTTIPLAIDKDLKNQSFFANWNLDSLDIESGTNVEVYVSVKDNDQINGAKETKAHSFILKIPTEEEIASIISDKEKGVEDQLDDTTEQAEDIARRLEEIEERLKSEQKLDWQEKKLIDDVIEDREKLSQEIEDLQKQHEDLQKSNNRFQKQSQQLQEKNQKMQELLNQLLDEETQKLYEKLKELLKENSSTDEVSQELSELKKNEQNLERDLERAVELFKRLKMESALENTLQKLDTLSKQQEQLSESPSDLESQNEINKEFDQFREKMDQVQELNQELKRPEAMEDFELEERQIAKELREIQEELEKEENADGSESSKDGGQTSEEDKSDQDQQSEQNESNQSGGNQNKQESSEKTKSQQKQKSAAQKMKNLSQKLNKMQGGMQMEMMQANLDQLRDILDNLIKLSFNQEEIMLEMREVNQSDPRFLELSQNQLKLKDDAKVIQDSLLSLAEQVVQISSFITREVGSINDNIDESIDFLKDRNRGRALSSQQFAMTSINNLALLLDDTMQQMQMAMSEAMGNSSQQQDQQSQGLPDLQEMQNQLGEQMNQLQGSGKSGRELSEELARLAAQQELIRRQMEMLKEAQDGKPGGGLGGDELKRAIDMMEQNEVDLVNKRITRQLINRQKQIITKMLEAEKAQRNQEMDEEREGQQPSTISREIPPGFEKYLELKRKEIELLKTIPIELNQFYKKEVNDYFRRLSSDIKE